jgi:hypothetical protein
MPDLESRETTIRGPRPAGEALSDAELQAMAARCEAATPGPWICVHSGSAPEPIVVSETVLNRRGSRMIVAATRWPLASLGADEAMAEANAHFVAAARSDMPRLLNELRWLRIALADQARVAAVGSAQERGAKDRRPADPRHDD